jgi:hypothetical protein
MPIETGQLPAITTHHGVTPSPDPTPPGAPAGDGGTRGFPFADPARERTAADGIPLARHPDRQDVRAPRKSLDITRVRRDASGAGW